MREINKPAQIIKMMDADDVDVVLEALGNFIRATDDDHPMSQRAWDIRQAVRATAAGSLIVQIGGEA